MLLLIGSDGHTEIYFEKMGWDADGVPGSERLTGLGIADYSGNLKSFFVRKMKQRDNSRCVKV
jgi:hypothetical protein